MVRSRRGSATIVLSAAAAVLGLATCVAAGGLAGSGKAPLSPESLPCAANAPQHYVAPDGKPANSRSEQTARGFNAFLLLSGAGPLSPAETPRAR